MSAKQKRKTKKKRKKKLKPRDSIKIPLTDIKGIPAELGAKDVISARIPQWIKDLLYRIQREKGIPIAWLIERALLEFTEKYERELPFELQLLVIRMGMEDVVRSLKTYHRIMHLIAEANGKLEDLEHARIPKAHRTVLMELERQIAVIRALNFEEMVKAWAEALEGLELADELAKERMEKAKKRNKANSTEET